MTDPGFGDWPTYIGAPAKGSRGPAVVDAVEKVHPNIGKADDAGAGAQGMRERGAPGADAERPASDTPASSERHKRKRQRRARGGKRKPPAPETPDAAGAVDAKAKFSGKSVSWRGGRSRGRKWRALQGRPLTCGSEAHPEGTRPAGAAESPHQEGDPRSRPDARKAPPAKPEPPRPAQNGIGPRPDIGPSSATPLYAALDLGTNNCRLLVAQPTRPGQFKVIDAFSRIVRLGEGLVGSGRLSESAMGRAIEALKVCAGKLESRPIRNRRLIATEACRAAVNGAEFLARVKAEAGLDLEIVDRETEARLAVSGCSSLVGQDARSVVLFDIGGGSSEIAVIDLGANRSVRLANHIRAWTSLPVGVVTLSEQHGGREVTRDTFDAMVGDVEALLARFDCPGSITGHHHAGGAAGFHLLGTSGTVTTLAGVYLDLPRYDRRRVDGLWLSNDDVDRMIERLLSWDFDQRSANPCIGADRADLVLAGCAILEAIRRRWPAQRMRVADRGLREGLLTEMMAADGAWRQPRRRRRPNRFARRDGAS